MEVFPELHDSLVITNKTPLEISGVLIALAARQTASYAVDCGGPVARGHLKKFG